MLERALGQDRRMIMVEFQIQFGFKFEFMPFLCGGRGARQGGLDSNLIHSGGEGINSNLIPHVFCPGMEGE